MGQIRHLGQTEGQIKQECLEQCGTDINCYSACLQQKTEEATKVTGQSYEEIMSYCEGKCREFLGTEYISNKDKRDACLMSCTSQMATTGIFKIDKVPETVEDYIAQTQITATKAAINPLLLIGLIGAGLFMIFKKR